MGLKLALLIANYTYEDEGLRGLTAPAHDAEALAEVLRDPDIAAFDEVTVLVDEPHHRIGQVIGEFFSDRRHDDLTLLYFTGHGLKDDEGLLHLATADTRRDNLLFTALPAERIDRAMTACMSRRQVLILDCCYSGAFPAARLAAKGDTDVRTLDTFHGRGRTVLTASDATQYSFEGDRVSGSAPQSVFTRHLVRGLRDGTADLDGDGDITLDELYAYVHDEVVKEIPQQRPKRQDNVEGRIVIARNVNWALPVHLRHALISPIASERLGAVDSLAHLYRVGNETVRRRAEEELLRLKDDDSRSVSGAAAAHLREERAAPAPSAAPGSKSGTERWSCRTGGPVRSAPTVVDGTVYVGSDDGSLYAVDAATGRQKWCSPLNAGVVRSAPAVEGDLVYVTAARCVYALDIRTGRVHWEFHGIGEAATTVGSSGDCVYFGSSGTLYTLDAKAGTKQWLIAGYGLTSYQWVVLAGPVAIVGNAGTHVHAFDAGKRRQVWGARVPHGPVSGPSALSDGLLYLGSEGGELVALDTSKGRKKWRYDTRGAIQSAPTVADGTVYVGNDDDRLYAVDSGTGELKWRFTIGAPIRSSPAVVGTAVCFGTDDGNVYAVDSATGLKRGRFPTGGPVRSSPAVADGVVYVGSDDGCLYAVEAAD